MNKGDFYAEKGASKSAAHWVLGTGVDNLGLLMYLHTQRNVRLPLS